MSAHAKKRKVDNECRVFNKTWTAKYFFTEIKGKAVRLICGTQVAVFKDFKLNRHYTSKHEDKYRTLSDEERTRESDALQAKLQTQQGLFTKLHTPRDAAVRTSYVISHKIIRKSKASSDGEFIKECLLDSLALMCPGRKRAHLRTCHSARRTVTRRVEDIAGNLERQLKNRAADFDCFSLAGKLD